MTPRQGVVILVAALAVAGAALFLSRQNELPADATRVPAMAAGPAVAPLPLVPIAPPVTELPAVSAAESLDDARLAALVASVRRKAAAVKGEELLKLPPKEGPFSPLFEESVPTAAELKAASADGGAGTPAVPEIRTTATNAGSRTGKGPFDSYPRGPEPPIPELAPGHHGDVRVLAPGRLDWTFVTRHQSLDPEPTSLMQHYVSTDQRYELYVPPGYDRHKYYPLLIHVTPGGGSDAWGIWQHVGQRHGIFVAGPHNAGNGVPMPHRCRVILDVLDDVRRRFPIDPDRTYISGTSGGGNASSRIAFALPELFGANIAIVGTWNLRPEPMLRRRVRERLSVAIVTGAGDFNGPELAREFYPILVAHHARARLWLYPDMGHEVPNPARLEEIFQWVEAGLPDRRANAAAFPASRLVEPLTPAAWSTALLLEAGERLKLPGATSGLFVLQGVADRWKGLPAADTAERLLKEFDAHAPAPWDKIKRAELLRFRYLQCQRFDGTLNSPSPPHYPVPRNNLVHIGLRHWQEVLDLSPAASPVAAEAKDRLAALRREIR